MPHAKEPDYGRKLTRRIRLADGTMLLTLRDAADLFTGERFAHVTKCGALERAIELVIEAAERGGRERIGAGTRQIMIVLRGAGSCDGASLADNARSTIDHPIDAQRLPGQSRRAPASARLRMVSAARSTITATSTIVVMMRARCVATSAPDSSKSRIAAIRATQAAHFLMVWRNASAGASEREQNARSGKAIGKFKLDSATPGGRAALYQWETGGPRRLRCG
jgi:hypothetical protein